MAFPIQQKYHIKNQCFHGKNLIGDVSDTRVFCRSAAAVPCSPFSGSTAADRIYPIHRCRGILHYLLHIRKQVEQMDYETDECVIPVIMYEL